MLRRRDLKLATNVKVIRSDNTGPQRRLLVMDIQLDLGQHWQAWKTRTERIKWWKLKDQLRLNDVDLDQPVDAIWNDVVRQIKYAASGALGNKKPGKQVIDKQIWWWNDKVQKVVKEKKAPFKAWHQSHSQLDYEQYKALTSAVKRAVTR